MGSWGCGILQDDYVSDIKYDYKTILSYGIDNDIALKKIKERYYDECINCGEEVAFWIAVSYVNWQYGIANDSILDDVIRVLDDETYLEVWRESGEKVYEKRKKIIKKYRNDLLYNKKPLKKIPKPPTYMRFKTSYMLGDLIAYQIGSTVTPKRFENIFRKDISFYSKWVLMHVVKIIYNPISKIMPELDYSSTAEVIIYDKLYDSKPDIDLKNLDIMDIYCPNTERRLRYNALQIDEHGGSLMDNDPQIILIGNRKVSFNSNIEGFYVDYIGIDEAIICSCKINSET